MAVLRTNNSVMVNFGTELCSFVWPRQPGAWHPLSSAVVLKKCMVEIVVYNSVYAVLFTACGLWTVCGLSLICVSSVDTDYDQCVAKTNLKLPVFNYTK